MKKTVIIGGGFSGSYTAKCLEKKFDVTLIDEKDYFEFTPSVLRTIVEPSHTKKIQVLHSHYLHYAQLVKGSVTHVSENKVNVGDKAYDFDYLVIASGSRYSSPIKEKNLVIASRAKELRQYAQKLIGSQKVLIIGGGVVGVELAAEIIDKFPKKEVTIVHSRGELIERNPTKAREYAKKFLLDKGVRIIFNEKVTNNGEYITNKGTKFSCDIAFLCVGIMPNYEHLGICSVDLNERKFLCVNEFLQVKGRKNIFAAGDINNIKEEKTAQAAENQASCVTKNIINLEKENELVPYITEKKPMVISLGKSRGIFVFGNFVLTGILPALLKWFVEKKAMWKYR
jgi:apoptosis-inducing factor 2